MALEAVTGALAALSDSERRTILSSLDDGGLGDEPLPAAEKMRRYRARRKLAAFLAQWRLPEA
jgi:hypothetical protein